MSVRTRLWLKTPWHNYADRQKYLIDEKNYANYLLYKEDNTHFNYGDFINAYCVTRTDLSLMENKPNYLIILNGETIESRWYVNNLQFVSGELTDSSKWQVILLRDIVVDKRLEIGKSNNVKTIRGMLPKNKWSALLSNPEKITTNDILQREIDLKDAFGIDWYTIYYDANNPIDISTSTTEPPNMRYTWTQLLAAFTFNGNIALTQSNGKISTIYGNNTRLRRISYFDIGFNARLTNQNSQQPGGTTTPSLYGTNENYIIRYTVGYNINDYPIVLSAQVLTDLQSKYTYSTGAISSADFDPRVAALAAANTIFSDNLASAVNSAKQDLRNVIDPIVDLYQNNYINIDNNATYFTVSRPSGTTEQITSDITAGLLAASLSGKTFSGDIRIGSYVLMYIRLFNPRIIRYGVYFERFDASGNRVTNAITLKLPQGNVLDEVVIGCITVPVSDEITLNISGSLKTISSGTIKRLVTGGVTAASGRDNIYAIEKLPYCPIPSLALYYEKNSKTLNIPKGSAVDALIQPMTDAGGSATWWGFRVQTASSEFIIDLPDDESLNPKTDFKRRAMTESVKISSPNHTAQMILRPIANQGLLKIRVQSTLRPNGTFYRWQPEFGGLHGFSTRDDRGIAQEGGFSIPIVTNAFIEFTRTNSMYREIFNTEVQFLESNNNIGRMGEQINADAQYNKAIRAADFQEKLSMMSASLGMYAGGIGLAGSMATQNPIAGAGSMFGIAGSMMQAEKSHMSGNFARNEAGIDYTVAQATIGLNDGLRSNSIAQKNAMFDLDIATIKNRPNTINQTSMLNVNNRGCAYIQIFSCTEQERLNVEKYIEMLGMNINQFGNINDFLSGNKCYLEAMLNFLEGSTAIELNAINAELSRGLFIQEGLFLEEV